MRHSGQEVFLSSHCWMQPLQKTCLLRVRVRVRARVARRRANAPSRRPLLFNEAGLQIRAAELPQQVALLEVGHADGALRRLHDGRQRQRRGLPRPREPLEQRLHQVGLLYAAGVGHAVRLHQPLEIAHWQAGERLRTCTRSGCAASEETRGGALSPTLQSPPHCAGVEGYGGRGGARGGWHRVAVPRSGRAAGPRRLRWRDRANSRPMRGHPTPTGCRKESPRLPRDHGRWTFGSGVGSGVGVRGEGRGRGGGVGGGGDCSTSLKMTKQVLATRELRNTEGGSVG